jgi:hypothetical protein
MNNIKMKSKLRVKIIDYIKTSIKSILLLVLYKFITSNINSINNTL